MPLRPLLNSLLALFLTPLALHASAPVLADGFEDAFKPVSAVPASPSKVSGTIPPRCSEDSIYPGADVAVCYTQVDDSLSGRGLRIDVERVTTGSSGLLRRDLSLRANTFYRLSFAVRSASGSSATVEVRSAAPHVAYLSQTISAAPEWKTHNFIVPPLKTDTETAQVRIGLERAGQMDFDDVSLVPVSEDEVGADFNGTGNLLPQSSFPSGLTSPWIGGAPWSGEHPQSDPQTPGPSGLPTLKVVPGYLAPLGQPYFEAHITAPFVGKPNAVHTLSAYLKGSKNGQTVRLRLISPTAPHDPAFVKQVTLSTEWQRYEFSAKLPYVSSGFYLASVYTHYHTPTREVQTFWVDQIQVEVGERATAFSRVAPVEVALHHGAYAGLFLEDQPLRVHASVWGEVAPGSALHGTFFDGSGQVFPVRAQPLKARQKFQTVSFTLPRGSELSFGSFRFAAEVKQGAMVVSKLQEISLGRVRNPRLRDVFAPDSPFGLHIPDNEKQTELARNLGFKWTRLWGSAENTVWAEVEKTDGTWDWSRPDRAIEIFRRHKFEILGVLGTHPKYSHLPKNAIWGNWLGSIRPDALPDYEAYARAAGTRYKGIITRWETHNETDLPSYFYSNIIDGKKVPGTPEEFTRQHIAAYRGLKAADPNITVWWNLAWARPNESRVFAEVATKAGIWDYVEGFSYHQYNGNFHAAPGNAVEKRIDEVYAVMPENKRHLPVWNTEGGFWPSEIRDDTPQVVPVVGKRSDFFADWVVRYYTFTLAKGIPRYFLFNMEHGGYRPGHEVLNADGSVSKLLLAFSNFAWHVEGKKFAQRLPLANGVNAYLFGDGKESVAVLLSSDARRLRLARPLSGTVARDIYGNDLAYPATLGDAPVFISGNDLTPEQFAERLAPIPGA